MSPANDNGDKILKSFAEVWLVDFEFHQPDGERPDPICMVAREWRSGRTLRLSHDDLRDQREAPFLLGPQSLLVSYYASAELGCFLSLDWAFPVRILDLFAEFRCLTSGSGTPCGSGLLGALAYFGIDGIDVVEKEAMRNLAIRGGPYTDDEQTALLTYCESDVLALDKLLSAMLSHTDVPRALLRGRYMAAAARMEWTGVPINLNKLDRLRANWPRTKRRLISVVDADYGVFVPTNRRTIDPETQLGAAILRTADEWGIEPYSLADAVNHVYLEERDSRAEIDAAILAARKATGLTAARIARWESSGGRDGRGRDYGGYPGFDVQARELAALHPSLGIGSGYSDDTGYDDTDYAGPLWNLLRDGTPAAKAKHHPDVLRRAAQMVADAATTFGADQGDAEPQGMTFSTSRFGALLAREDVPWPRLKSGALALDDGTFREMAKAYPSIAPLRELRHALSELRLERLAVGRDGRNRCLLSAFASKTGRNQPSNAKYIFGPSVWLRGLIQPEPGRALAYVDWEQQEFGIAAALSGDRAMLSAYASGDPYLEFAKQAGAVPASATKATHAAVRDQFKACVLAVQYGMGEQSLAQRIGQSDAHARELLRLHKATYPTFWQWSQAAVDHAMLHGWLQTVFGWRVHVGPDANPRSLANFPMQANGAEMLRLACCLATERGIRVCGPVHDALLVEGPIDEIESVVESTKDAMREASEIVLTGFALRTDAKIVRYPEPYSDQRGKRMWEAVWRIVEDLDRVQDELANVPDPG